MRRIFWTIKRSASRILLGCAVVVLITGQVWAEDTENGNQDAPSVPKIETTVTVDDDETRSTATDKKPAMGTIFEVTQYDDNDEKSYREYEKIMDKEGDIVTDVTNEAKKEAKALAKELLDNGRYKELLGYKNAYVRSDYDTIVTENVSISKEDNHTNPKNPHSSGYYSNLKDKYPHIMEFCFRKRTDGKIYYWYSFFCDYSSLDYSKINKTYVSDWFNISDDIVITGLDPKKWYALKTTLLKINDDGSTKEIDSTEWYYKGNQGSRVIHYEIDEDGTAKLWTYFLVDDMEEGKYVLTSELRYENGDVIVAHDDLNNNRESFVINRKSYDNSFSRDGEVIEDYNFITFNSGSSASGKYGLPSTGDDFNPWLYILMMSLSLPCIIRCAPVNKTKKAAQTTN